MFAEFSGKDRGCCRGRGGSMHIADVNRGDSGANGAVGGGLPIAVGTAPAAQRLATGAVTLCFFGDGASNRGASHESPNKAAPWNLPAVIFSEINMCGLSTSMQPSTACSSVAERAAIIDDG